MIRKVIKSEIVSNGNGHPSTWMKLECGHEVWFRHKFPHQCKRATTNCADCDRTCVDCGKKGATRGPCPYAMEINNDLTPVDLCKECGQKRAWDI